jgi:RNA polymerase sigma factor (sigma-70 family)
MDVTDAELLAAARESPKVFGELFERHFDAVHRFCVRRVGATRGEDLAGETFRRAFEHRDRYDLAVPNARPWLLGIAMNLVRSELRSRTIHDRAYQRLVDATSMSAHNLVEDAFNGLSARDDLAVVARLLLQLPEDDVEALFLHVWDGLTYAEVATSLGVAVGTVRSRLSRLRRRLETMLAETDRYPGLGTGIGGR